MTVHWLISVDDHMIESPNVWIDRAPSRYRVAAPHVVREDGREVSVDEDTRGVTGSALNVMVEVEYPHSDTTWPDSIKLMRERVAELTSPQQYKVLRGNAERLFRFTPADPAALGG